MCYIGLDGNVGCPDSLCMLSSTAGRLRAAEILCTQKVEHGFVEVYLYTVYSEETMSPYSANHWEVYYTTEEIYEKPKDL